jgi:uncharacterized ion transporter superfamily protein YfcC
LCNITIQIDAEQKVKDDAAAAAVQAEKDAVAAAVAAKVDAKASKAARDQLRKTKSRVRKVRFARHFVLFVFCLSFIVVVFVLCSCFGVQRRRKAARDQLRKMKSRIRRAM